MVAIVPAVTVVVWTVNVAVVAPAPTVTQVCTVAAGLLLASVTIAPPTGAALPSVTVPVLPLPPPPVTAAGKTLTLTSDGFSVSVEFVDAPRHVAVMVTAVGTVTDALVVTGNV